MQYKIFYLIHYWPETFLLPIFEIQPKGGPYRLPTRSRGSHGNFFRDPFFLQTEF